MAQLKKKVLGQVSGAVGDMVFRERNGANYVGLRPDSFMPGLDPVSVARRNRFAIATKVGVSINSISQLKLLWKVFTPPGMNPYNFIVKTNYRFVTSSSVSDLLKLVPDNGFGVTLSESNVNRDKVNAVIGPIGTNAGINTVTEPTIRMTALVFLSSPLDISVGAYSILTLASPAQPINLATELTFDALLTNQQQVIFDKYQVTKSFIALVTLDAEGNPVHYSSTVLLV